MAGHGCSKKGVGEPCDDATECESDLCVDGSPALNTVRRVCTSYCKDDAECGSGESCFSGRCAARCEAQDDCPDENVCSGELCAVVCRSDADCVNAVCSTPGALCEAK